MRSLSGHSCSHVTVLATCKKPQILAIELLAEKATITHYYETYVLLMDTSKAFDSVDKKIAIG